MSWILSELNSNSAKKLQYSSLKIVPLLENPILCCLHQCCSQEFTWKKQTHSLDGHLPSTGSIDGNTTWVPKSFNLLPKTMKPLLICWKSYLTVAFVPTGRSRKGSAGPTNLVSLSGTSQIWAPGRQHTCQDERSDWWLGDFVPPNRESPTSTTFHFFFLLTDDSWPPLGSGDKA